LLSSEFLPGLDGEPVDCIDGERDEPRATRSGFPAPCAPSGVSGISDRLCCSDDPSAFDPDIPPPEVVPAYGLGPGGSGEPIFSAGRNDASGWGVCVGADFLPRGAGVVVREDGAECPLPCDPTWRSDQVDAVCGSNSLCCQTQETDESDCVMDLSLGCFRAVSGLDIVEPTVQTIDGQPVRWAQGDFATMQDGDGIRCRQYANGDTEAEIGCFRSLRTAAQRGFCMGRSAEVQGCPLADPNYEDACERLNRERGWSCG